MSKENVEAVRQAIEAWNRGGGPSEAVVNLAHPDCVVHPFPEWPDDAVYKGRDGWRRLTEQWSENFDRITWEGVRLIDKDPALVALVTHRATTKGTGVPLSQPLGLFIADFRDGMAVEARFYLTWDEALEAAGLSE